MSLLTVITPSGVRADARVRRIVTKKISYAVARAEKYGVVLYATGANCQEALNNVVFKMDKLFEETGE